MRRIGTIVTVLALLTAACSFPTSRETTTTTVPAATTTNPDPVLATADQVAVIDAVQGLLDAWARGDFATVRERSPDAPHDLLGLHVAWTGGLSLRGAQYQVTSAELIDGIVVATYRAALDLGSAGTWPYEGALTVEQDGTAWVVPWSPAVVHPALEENDTLFLERRWPDRAAILGTTGITLVTDRAVKEIGVVPGLIEDQDALLEALEELAGIPPSTVLREIGRPAVQPDWYVPVGWLPLVDYLPVQSQLEAVPGLDLRDDTARLAPAGPFADHVLGTTGPVTAELLDRLGDPYRVGDVVGLSGMERDLERTLAGRPTFEVQRVNQFGRIVEILHTVEGVTPNPVRTTLSVDTQLAAEAALADVELPAALVAVDIDTGRVRAIASRPLDGFNRAVLGLYPPGSTSKVVTSYGLLTAGYRPASEVPCPGRVTIGGRDFTNAGERDRGDITLAEALAASCNTTFAALAADVLGPDGLTAAAADFGYGSVYELAIDTAVPRFPDPPEDADVAASAIGQGAVQVTPLHQASIAAAVAAGAWTAPTLLESADPGDSRPLDPEALDLLARMMRLVVTDGTGTAADVAGEIVYGKTGSAEWSETEPTHAWFIGYWDGLGFAVVVEAGGAGGSVAAPIAAAFIEALAG
jgi:cell division protein FtsI/penicillin-binding protein 2